MSTMHVLTASNINLYNILLSTKFENHVGVCVYVPGQPNRRCKGMTYGKDVYPAIHVTLESYSPVFCTMLIDSGAT